jgi:hypothetical protein
MKLSIMSDDLKKRIVGLSKDWLKSEVTNTIAAITIGYVENEKVLRYVLYYLNEENKFCDEDIVEYLSGEINAQIWQMVEKIEIDSILYGPDVNLNKLDCWVYIKEDLVHLVAIDEK